MLFPFASGPALYKSAALKKHAVNVVKTVGKAVELLEDLDTLVPILTSLGTRHVKYGIVEAHYLVVGQALLETLAEGLGDDFTPEAKVAWEAVFGIVSETMIGSNYQ